MLKKIEKWLKSDEQDYDDGLLLLSRASRNRNMINMLSRKERPAKLRYELTKVADRLRAKANYKPPEPPEHLVITGKESMDEELQSIADGSEHNPKGGTVRRYNPDELPEDLAKLWKQNKNDYHVLRAKHLQLQKMDDNTADERAPLVTEILQLDERIRKNWNTIDTRMNGKGEDTETTKEPTEAALVDAKRIAANRKFISSNKGKLGKMEGEKKDILLKQLKQRITEIIVSGETFSEKQIESLKKLGLIEQ